MWRILTPNSHCFSETFIFPSVNQVCFRRIKICHKWPGLLTTHTWKDSILTRPSSSTRPKEDDCHLADGIFKYSWITVFRKWKLFFMTRICCMICVVMWQTFIYLVNRVLYKLYKLFSQKIASKYTNFFLLFHISNISNSVYLTVSDFKHAFVD